jgi:glycine cleavage system aminomethyltransferase T
MAIGQGYVAASHAQEGKPVAIEVRGKKIAGEITPLAFLTPKTKSSAIDPAKEKKYG